jgi:hypothetical protein
MRALRRGDYIRASRRRGEGDTLRMVQGEVDQGRTAVVNVKTD